MVEHCLGTSNSYNPDIIRGRAWVRAHQASSALIVSRNGSGNSFVTSCTSTILNIMG